MRNKNCFLFLTRCLYPQDSTGNTCHSTHSYRSLAGHHNIYLAGLIGGLGALVGDLIVFIFIRHSFRDEIKKLSKERIVLYINHKTPNLFKKYLLPLIAGFIIASPLPDEIGVSLLAAYKTFSIKIFSIISYLLNTAGIFAILFIGNMF